MVVIPVELIVRARTGEGVVRLMEGEVVMDELRGEALGPVDKTRVLGGVDTRDWTRALEGVVVEVDVSLAVVMGRAGELVDIVRAVDRRVETTDGVARGLIPLVDGEGETALSMPLLFSPGGAEIRLEILAAFEDKEGIDECRLDGVSFETTLRFAVTVDILNSLPRRACGSRAWQKYFDSNNQPRRRS
jgi:hypothetical protein